MDELKQLQAASYVMGDLESRELLNFEESIEHHPELSELVSDLHEVSTALLRVAPVQKVPEISDSAREDLFNRITSTIDQRDKSGQILEESTTDGMVVTDREGKILWVNEEFTQLCGYDLTEVIGRKPGSFLQGQLTDRKASTSMRRAVHGGYGCVEELINYHKNGDPYWVRITITPVLDEHGQTSKFIALEKKLEERLIEAA